jgi:glycosyltransferase involved in cell wall biosynthesis
MIAIFLPSLQGGGAERAALFLGRTLAAAGHDVEFAVADARGFYADEPFIRARLVDLGVRQPLLCLPAYLRYLSARRPALVISMVHSANLISGIGRRAVPGHRLIVSVHNSLEKPAPHQWWVRRWLGFGLERRLYREADAVHAVSHEVAAQCRTAFDLDPARLIALYNERPASLAGPVPPDHPARGLGPYILTGGRLVALKAFDIVIRAFAEAALPQPWTLVVCGDGPERARLVRMADGLGLGTRVIFPGHQVPIEPWMAGAAGFAYASRGEGFCGIVHEALVTGLPTIVADCVGIREVVGDGRFATILPVDDVAAFARGLRHIAAGTLAAPDPSALAAHLAQFEPAAIARQYLALVETILAGEGIPADLRRPAAPAGEAVAA